MGKIAQSPLSKKIENRLRKKKNLRFMSKGILGRKKIKMKVHVAQSYHYIITFASVFTVDANENKNKFFFFDN